MNSTASLGSRVAAFAFDYLPIAAYLVALVVAGAVAREAAPDAAGLLFGSAFTGEATGFLLVTLPVSLYFVFSEASAAGATWGKRRMRLRVVDDRHQRLGLGRSAWRTSLKFVPWELSHSLVWQFAFAGADPPVILSVGLVVVWAIVGANVASVFFDRRHRAIYDRLARTLVVTRA